MASSKIGLGFIPAKADLVIIPGDDAVINWNYINGTLDLSEYLVEIIFYDKTDAEIYKLSSGDSSITIENNNVLASIPNAETLLFAPTSWRFVLTKNEKKTTYILGKVEFISASSSSLLSQNTIYSGNGIEILQENNTLTLTTLET